MSRAAHAAALCSLAVVGWFGAPTASAHPARVPALAKAARALASVILKDTYQVGPVPSETALVAAASCCGWSERHVYYRAVPGHYATYGGYELSLEEVGQLVGGVIRKVTILEFPTTAPAPFFPDPTLPPTFSLSILHNSLKLNKDWSGSVEYHYDPYCPEPPIPTCVAWSTARVLTGHPRLVHAVFMQALAVMEKAHRHEPISAENSRILQEIEG